MILLAGAKIQYSSLWNKYLGCFSVSGSIGRHEISLLWPVFPANNLDPGIPFAVFFFG